MEKRTRKRGCDIFPNMKKVVESSNNMTLIADLFPSCIAKGFGAEAFLIFHFFPSLRHTSSITGVNTIRFVLHKTLK